MAALKCSVKFFFSNAILRLVVNLLSNISTCCLFKSLFDMDHPYIIPSREQVHLPPNGKCKIIIFLGGDMIDLRTSGPQEGIYMVCAKIQAPPFLSI